jgi:hypothetical protein
VPLLPVSFRTAPSPGFTTTFQARQQLFCIFHFPFSWSAYILSTLFLYKALLPHTHSSSSQQQQQQHTMTKQAKLETFLKKQGVKVSPDRKKPHSSSLSKQQKQARLQQCAGVLVLPTMGGGGARDEELQRLLSELDASRSDEVITQALRQLGCYEVTVEQVGCPWSLQFARQ